MDSRLYEQIAAYVPENAQEESDRRLMLRYLGLFDDMLTRENELVHFTASGWIVNPDRSRVLMIYHNIFKSWAWVGGHADGEADLLSVARREIAEETGLHTAKLLHDGVFGLSIQVVEPHIKRGKYVSSHLHCDLQYLFEASEREPLVSKPDENSGVAWLAADTLLEKVNEEHMKPLYEKLIRKVGRLYAANG